MRVEKDPAAGLIFWTKGDNREQMDGFGNPASAVRGIVVRRVPILGYLLMYLQSPPGWIFIGLTIFFYIIYRFGGMAVEKLKKWDPGKTDPKLLERLERQEEVIHQQEEAFGIFTKAVERYGIHQQSHTRLVQRMGDSTERLTAVVERLDVHLGRLIGEKGKEGPKHPPMDIILGNMVVRGPIEDKRSKKLNKVLGNIM